MNQTLHAICVFCGSNNGQQPEFKQDAEVLGQLLAEKNIQLIFGGSNVGLMGTIAQSVMSHGGEAIGIIPKKIFENVELPKLTDLQVVHTMHERKAKMHELSDGFIALPGGIGTLEELAETMTWSQIGYHKKTIGLLNTNHFYDPFINLLKHMSQEGFYNEKYLQNLVIEETPQQLIEKMMAHLPISLTKWD